MKSKKREPSKNDLIKFARSVYQSAPFATKLYLAMQTKISIEFIKDNWNEITMEQKIIDKNKATKKKTIGEDLKKYVADEINTMAESHIECWKDRYFRKSKKDIRFDLIMNHDNSLEVETTEEDLKRKLTDGETNFLNRKFIMEVTRIIY